MKVKIIGCGGSGTNTINRIVKANLKDVETYAINSDKALRYSLAQNKIMIGEGSSCGGNIDKARQIINKDIDKIKNIVKNSKAMILTTGMGGGFGTACVYETAKIAKELNVPTIVIVTKPFKVEGEQRNSIATNYIGKLKKCAKCVFVIQNDNLFSWLDSKTEYGKLFEYTDGILRIVIEEVNNVVNSKQNVVGIDLEDLEYILKETNSAKLKLSLGKTFKETFDNTISNRIFEDIDTTKVKNVLINVSYKNDSQYNVSVAKEVFDAIKNTFPSHSYLKVGNTINKNLIEEFRVLLIVS